MPGARPVSAQVRELAARELARFTDALSRQEPLARVHAFGSFARGDMHAGSDLDLLVIGPFLERRPKRVERLLDLAWELNLQVPVEILALSFEEWDQVKERPFFRHLQSEWVPAAPRP